MEDKDKDSGENEPVDKKDKVNNGEQQADEEKKKEEQASKDSGENESVDKENYVKGEQQAKKKKKKKKQANKNKEEPTASEKQQAEEAENEALVEKALKAYCCYLYVGKGHPYYKAQPWNDDESYPMEERLRNLEILASNKKTELVPINKIKLAMDTKLVRRQETLMFALAMCARQKKSEKLRAAAYYFLTEHCKEWKNFVLFIKYTSMLCKLQGSTLEKDGTGGHIGCGRGWKNAVNKWYLDKSAWDLIILVTQHKGNYGWTHKDILKLSHIDTTGLTVEKSAIFCYVMHGMEKAQEKYTDSEEAMHHLQAIARIEHFRKCKDPKVLIDLFWREGGYTIDHVHPEALKNKMVWEELLTCMDIRTMLKYLTKTCDLGFLTQTSKATARVVNVLTSESNIEWNKILPGDILTVLNRYELGPIISRPYRIRMDLQNRGECMKASIQAKEDDAKILADFKLRFPTMQFDAINRKNKKPKISKEEKKKRRSRPEKAPDMRVRDALRTALQLSQNVDITGASQRTYLIGIRLPTRRRNTPCAEVGLAIGLPLMHRAFISDDASSVTILGYEPRTMMCTEIPLSLGMSFDDALQAIYKTKEKHALYYTQPLDPVKWAIFKKKKYDVIIDIANEPPTKDILGCMGFYREKLGLPQARLINIVNNRSPFQLKGDIWHESLTINGNDPHVPWVIEAYCRGLF